MPQRGGSYFHLHLISDATGETLTTVARAATAQYSKVVPVEHVYALVRTQKQLDRVQDEIEDAPGIVLCTLLDDELLQRLEGYPYIGRALHWMRENVVVSAAQVQGWIMDSVQSLLKSAAARGGGVALGIFGTLVGFVMMLFLLFFLHCVSNPWNPF